MKKIFTAILFLALIASFGSCDNYLDIVPDERPTEEDAFRNPNDAKGYLYSIYGYIPNQRDGTSSMDLLTSDEVVTAFEHEIFARFPRGEYTASSPVISYWNDLYRGIRQAYIFLDKIDDVEGISAATAKRYKAEANFLVGYLHFLLLRNHGPIVIMDRQFDIDTPAEEFPKRSTYEESVDFIANKLDEAAQELPMQQSSSNYGRATSVIAKAIKARLLLYAASPQFNGGGANGQSLYQGFVDNEGVQLISTNYDESKWARAAVANREAIQIAEAAGNQLYLNSTYSSDLPSNPIEKDLRYTFIDKNSKEIIWANTRPEGIYNFQNKSTPYIPGSSGTSWNGISPTFNIMNFFYTENGLPIDKDPNFNYNGRFNVVSTENGNTLSFNLHREPRFNAWISYHNGYFEVIRGDDKQVLTQYRRDDAQGIQGRSNNYSPTGYLNKKGVAPLLDQSRLQVSVQYPWPMIRLSELYLNYAEALIESNQNLSTAKEYIDRVRTRAGIPTIDEAWGPIGGANDQNMLREIVRQERTIELYLENHRFWDLRRWQVADQYLAERLDGLNIEGSTDEDFFQIRKVNFPRSFSQRNYLMPIPQAEIDKNENLIQNPGY